MNDNSSTHDSATLQPAIEAMARETGLPVGAVEQVYRDEHSRLAAAARIKTYLPLITRNRVRTILRTRGDAL